MSQPRYFEWDYDTKIVREYERSGECNGCGQCCIYLIQYRTVHSYKPEGIAPLGDQTKAEGIWFEVSDGEHRRFMQPQTITERPRTHACPHLDDELRCAIHHLKDWRRDSLPMCDAFPIHPSQVEALSECSYTFRLVREGTFEV